MHVFACPERALPISLSGGELKLKNKQTKRNRKKQTQPNKTYKNSAPDAQVNFPTEKDQVNFQDKRRDSFSSESKMYSGHAEHTD